MSSELNVSEDVKALVREIIYKNEWLPVIEVKYYAGAKAGDGYACKHVIVDIISKNTKFRLFVKYTHDTAKTDADVEKFYANEIYFYEVVFPAYSSFLAEKSIENGFRNVSKYYGSSIKYSIALENLKDKEFTLFNRNQTMNDKHILLVLKTLAKFHAASHAFKDQKREVYDKFQTSTPQDYMLTNSKGRDSPSIKLLKDMINDGLSKFDPDADKHILEKCNADVILSPVTDVKSYLNENSILIHGDCWCNNMMFLYEAEEKDNPIDVALVDWQLLRVGSAIFDISYFFYSVADQDALNKLDFYLEQYYIELSHQIKILGSEPNSLYPFSAFEKEWKSHCKYGFATAFMLIKFMLATTDEAPELGESVAEDLNVTDIFPKFANELEYYKRLRMLCEFMVNKNYL